MVNKRSEELATIAITKKDGVAVITLNRPEKLNALSPELLEDLIQALDEVAGDEAVRAVIITGAGRAFSAGGDVEKDIAPLREKSPSEFNRYMGQAVVMYKAVMDMEKPVIAAVNGHAIGAGLDLAMVCDIRIAAEDAQLGEFFVKMGLTPEIGIYLMSRLIGLGKAKLLSLTGDLIDAREAERIGLVDKVVPPDRLMSSAEELAGKLAGGTKAIGIIKRGINESLRMTVDSSLDYVCRLQYQLVHTEDHEEAVTAWLQKRTPVFKGR
jgi:enoyl-CoA hydratase/carnithine racemase